MGMWTRDTAWSRAKGWVLQIWSVARWLRNRRWCFGRVGPSPNLMRPIALGLWWPGPMRVEGSFVAEHGPSVDWSSRLFFKRRARNRVVQRLETDYGVR